MSQGGKIRMPNDKFLAAMIQFTAGGLITYPQLEKKFAETEFEGKTYPYSEGTLKQKLEKTPKGYYLDGATIKRVDNEEVVDHDTFRAECKENKVTNGQLGWNLQMVLQGLQPFDVASVSSGMRGRESAIAAAIAAYKAQNE